MFTNLNRLIKLYIKHYKFFIIVVQHKTDTPGPKRTRTPSLTYADCEHNISAIISSILVTAMVFDTRPKARNLVLRPNIDASSSR